MLMEVERATLEEFFSANATVEPVISLRNVQSEFSNFTPSILVEEE